MTPIDDRAEFLSAAVFDNRPVDWEDELRRTTDPELERIVRNLQKLAQVAAVHERLRAGAATRTPDWRRLAFVESGAATPAPAVNSPLDLATASTATFTPNPLGAGRLLGARYRIERSLGCGGMGEVWAAFDLKLGVEVALKSLRREGAAWRETLRREVRDARTVLSPNVCRIFDLVDADGMEFLSMEYIDGDTLRDTLQRRGPIELREASAVAAQFLAGLEAIHAAGLVHRDVKPENVMVTRSGRVVVMDLGIARSLAAPVTGSIAGTPGYMAPEQAAGEAVDARADVFAAGIVLAELLEPSAARNRDGLAKFLQGIREVPPRLSESAWRPVIERALSFDLRQRHGSVTDLARALEAATQRAAGPSEGDPYPGLAAFTEENAEMFFGREGEVEAMWKKLQRLHLLAVVGPSGVGKSSFLRAGVLPARPHGWASLYCNPGVSPFIALGQALAPQLAGDSNLALDFLRFQEPQVALELFARWRARHIQALVVVDQFEELFTLNRSDVQESFADLLARLALEADVHVLLSMRDDFLFRCHAHPSLAPVFAELTPLGPPRGSDLRRAIALPALACGYRFEDEALEKEMVAQVSEERGALPLLAFAAARLWDLRDRDRGLLTRQAYEQIGGVGGALAQHAEEVFGRIGAQRQSIVRELFRNLVTAEGTRVARDRGELLSVFDDQDAAAEVLGELVNARLLTTFEVATGKDETAPPRPWIEIVHESLLAGWPRLVHWRTQDVEGAQLRDQLRQAAQLWQDRGRRDDLVWAGTVYREFALWRERNPGRLSSMEEQFAAAMDQRAQRQRRRRRLMLATAFAALASVLVVVVGLWRRSEIAQRHAEAGKLSALAQASPKPWLALAGAIASLELEDRPDVRRLAIEQLQKEPTRFQVAANVPNTLNLNDVQFSPDAKWLALHWFTLSGVQLLPLSGGATVDLAMTQNGQIWGMAFSRDSQFFAVGKRDSLFVYSSGTSEPIHKLKCDGTARPYYCSSLDGWMVCERQPDRQSMTRWRAVLVDGRTLHDFGWRDTGAQSWPQINAAGSHAVVYEGEGVTALWAMRDGQSALERRIPGIAAYFDARGEKIATLDDSFRVRLWPLDRTGESQLVGQGGPLPKRPSFDPTGTQLVWPFGEGIRVWDLSTPAWIGQSTLDADIVCGAFHPSGRWFVGGTGWTVSAWPLSSRHAIRLPRAPGTENRLMTAAVAISPDGRWLAAGNDGSIRLWPLEGDAPPREVYHLDGAGFALRFDSSSQRLFALQFDYIGETRHVPRELIAISVESGEIMLQTPALLVDFSVHPRGNLVACTYGGQLLQIPELVEIPSGKRRNIELPGGRPTRPVGFTSDGRLLLLRLKSPYWDALWKVEPDTLFVQDLATGTTQMVTPDVAWIWSWRAGEFLWKDATGRFWLGDPLVGHPRAIGTSQIEELTRDWRARGRIQITEDAIAFGKPDRSIEIYGLDGGPPHLLLGHEAAVTSVAIDPRRRWIASGDAAGDVRLWPMPTGVPLQTLPAREFLAKLKSLTNMRAVPDSTQPNGYDVRAEPFPGWDPVPTW